MHRSCKMAIVAFVYDDAHVLEEGAGPSQDD